jgi:hypothetical protein
MTKTFAKNNISLIKENLTVMLNTPSLDTIWGVFYQKYIDIQKNTIYQYIRMFNDLQLYLMR